MGILATISSVLLEYDTLKVVHIKSKKVGIINRLIQLAIVSYIIGFVIVYKKGYQESEPVDGAVTAKLKGAAFPFDAGSASRVWDAADYHIPPQQTNGFFVMTNMIITPNQRNGTCPESLKNKRCTTDSDCQANTMVRAGNGLMTGRCIDSSMAEYPAEYDGHEDIVLGNGTSSANRSCEIVAWCPLERDVTPKTALLGQDARDFTVLLKNTILFRKFNVKRRNIPTSSTADFLKKCRFDPNDPVNKSCPIFALYDIFKHAGVADQWNTSTASGAVMAIDIAWNCNLDDGVEACNPEYSFRRVDNPDVGVSPGFNFRYAQYHSAPDGTKTRTLTKAYGVLFAIKITGNAGKFSIVPLMVNLGSGLALLGVATILCDFVVIHFLKRRDFYKEKKFEDVEVEDDLDLIPDRLRMPGERDPLVQKSN